MNGYIGRVLSSSDSNLVDPDLLRDASSIAEMGDSPGLDLDTLNEWRSFANHDPNPDEFLYHRLLLAQCKALAEGIPALFDPRQNYQALFLPGNLLNQDSIVRRLVKEIPEEDWQNIEVVGWLYQFYISERKDEVIGAKSKVAAADIPAATQLFTPHWIVQYMVENSLGRLWLESHPESRLREYMPYFLEAGEKRQGGEFSPLPPAPQPIIPITDQAYFDNDIVTRFIEFLRVAYSPETLTENLNFIANALTLKNGESAQERIRRYFLQEFISDHIQTYKKRPIYWLFTSGKKRAFGALLYLHRYSEDALARIRTDYVLELQVKLDGEIARAQQQLDNTTYSAAKKAATNRLKELQAQQLELRNYQAKLQTQADARINLDLDDGVAYNYTRFKGLVYEGADLKIAHLEKAAQWKRELLK
ncbi:restriction endonuclease [Nostoc sp.]|uniref:restriction endonuclease n=1 Tax=Nostoc sp. TaxID=1180 RepID=UPI002FF4F061